MHDSIVSATSQRGAGCGALLSVLAVSTTGAGWCFGSHVYQSQVAGDEALA